MQDKALAAIDEARAVSMISAGSALARSAANSSLASEIASRGPASCRSSAMPAERWSKSTTPTAASAFFRGDEARGLDPMRGVKTTSATRLVRSIHGLTRKRQCDDEHRRPVARQHQHRFDQYGMKPTSHDTRGRPRVVGVDEECIEPPIAARSRRAAHRTRRPAARPWSARSGRGAWSCSASHAGTSNSSRGCGHSTSTPVSVTTTASPSTR